MVEHYNAELVDKLNEIADILEKTLGKDVADILTTVEAVERLANSRKADGLLGSELIDRMNKIASILEKTLGEDVAYSLATVEGVEHLADSWKTGKRLNTELAEKLDEIRDIVEKTLGMEVANTLTTIEGVEILAKAWIENQPVSESGITYSSRVHVITCQAEEIKRLKAHIDRLEKRIAEMKA